MHGKSKLLVAMICASASMVGAAAEPDAKQVLSEVAQAVGAGATLRSIELAGSGQSFTVGQAGAVKLPWPKFNEVSYTRVISFDPWATRLDRVRTQGESPPRGGGGQPIVGEQKQTQAIAAGTPAAATISDELALISPQALVKAAAAAGDLSARSESKQGKKYVVLSYTALNKATTRAWVNEQHLIERVETRIDNVVLGDIDFTVKFSDYRDFGGVKFPGRIEQAQAGQPVLNLQVSSVKADVPVEIQAAAPTPTPPLTSEQLAPGIYLISGGYAAVVIDFKDHITVIEGGQNDQRSAAVIAEVKRLIPGKPIGELVNTHAHFDHSGGVRAYVAEGATIVTHKDNIAYFKRIWANPHTIAPDRLAQNPRAARFKGVDDKLTLTDGDKVVELYRAHDLVHHDGLIFAYLPKEKVLVEADAFNPPPAPLTQPPAVINPNARSLLANIDRLRLEVQRIVPVHLPADNRKVTLAELRTAAGQTE